MPPLALSHFKTIQNETEKLAMHRTMLLLLSAAFLVGLAPQVRADGLIANWPLSEPAGSQLTAGTTFADSGPNGLTATLYGTDTLTTIAGPFGASGPQGLYFSGAAAGNLGNNGVANNGQTINNPNPTYLGVPYNAALSNQIVNGLPTSGLWNLTISARIDLPTAWGSSSPCSEIVSYYNASESEGNNGYPDGTQMYQLGDGFSGTSHRMYFEDGLQGGTAFDRYYESNPNATPGKWQLITATYNGIGTGSNPVCTLYENGVCIQSNDGTPESGNTGSALPQAVTSGVYSTLYIANGWEPRDNEWIGGLSDIGMWNVCLTGGVLNTADNIPIAGTSGGQISAMYNAPTSAIAALQQYGVSAMDKLFTLYDTKPALPTTVTTGNGTLTWKYLASGLTGTSGGVGELSGGGYYMQFDSAGGGVETVLPGDANLDGQVDINDLTVVLSHYDQTGMTWTEGEFTGDGKVDINDLTIVLAHYNQSVGASGSLAAVPEPGSAALLAAVAAGLLACAWRTWR